MKSKYIIIVAVVIIGFIGYYSFRGGDNTDYLADITKAREVKDAFMRSSDESPFGEQKKKFKGLNYFSVDKKYRINANLVTIKNKNIVDLPTSDGIQKPYREYGYAEFELNQTSCRLLILEIMEAGPNNGTLFLAFADSTSAFDTYGAGRYLDVKKVPGASFITLDFNEAYNPYCAYSENFSCPFPPKENVLKVAVRAGEKKYHD